MSFFNPNFTQSSKPKLVFDPESYVPDLPESAHLEFVQPENLDMYTQLLNDDIPESVRAYLQQGLDKALSRAHDINSHKLACRVIHKYLKWGPVRFGKTCDTQRDFYDGSVRLDSAHNIVSVETVFLDHLERECHAAGINVCDILDNIHLGQTSLTRFKDFFQLTPIEEVYTDMPPLEDECMEMKPVPLLSTNSFVEDSSFWDSFELSEQPRIDRESEHLEFVDPENDTPEARLTADLINGQELANRVVHKFLKWGHVRFGQTEETQRDFYDGSTKLKGPIAFSPILKHMLRIEAEKEDVNPDWIMDHLYVGETSARRFSNFLSVPLEVVGHEASIFDSYGFNESESESELESSDSNDSDSDDDVPEFVMSDESDSDDLPELIETPSVSLVDPEAKPQIELVSSHFELVKPEDDTEEAKTAAFKTNCHNLAARVIHKFKKWPQRFNSMPADFYDGSKPIGSTVLYEPTFLDTLKSMAKHQGVDVNIMMVGLRLGEASNKRFADFMYSY